MAATPEVLRPENQIKESQEEFIVPETLQQDTGIKVVPKNFQAQVRDDNNKPLIQTPPAQVFTITPPADDTTLTSWSKGNITSALSWLGMFWIRMIKKALHLGWKVERN